MPPEVMLFGVPLIVVVPACVELVKRLGLRTEFAGLAAIGFCALFLGLVELRDDATWGTVATWALGSIVYGLAAAGFYSQAVRLTGRQ